jgi:ectoine hydroxylase-related dioxygenase (phytanoyl-CoA dioxygenase family)
MNAAMQPTVSLTPDQIAFYHANGFLALSVITTQDEVQWMREIYDHLFASRAGREEGNQFDLGGSDEEGKAAVLPQILNPSKYAPELKEGLFRVNAMHVAKQLLGEQVIPMGEHAILKPARYGAETPWHQDEAYWGEQMQYNSFSMWIPLQPATMENGCMQFIPASHKSDVVPHHSIGHDPRVHGLEMDALPDARQAVACPIPAGGCTIHSNRTMHYAGANRSDIPRRALILGFGIKPTPYAGPPREFTWNKLKQTPRDERAKAAQSGLVPSPLEGEG